MILTAENTKNTLQVVGFCLLLGAIALMLAMILRGKRIDKKGKREQKLSQNPDDYLKEE